MPLAARVRKMVSYGMTSAMISTVVERKKTCVDDIRRRHNIYRPKYPCSVHTRVTERCWNALVAAARTHGATSPNRVAGVTLELVTAERLDLLPVVLPPAPPRPGAPISSLLSPMLQARIGGP